MEIFTAFAGELERSIAWGSGGFYYPWWCGSPGTEKSWTVRGDEAIGLSLVIPRELYSQRYACSIPVVKRW